VNAFSALIVESSFSSLLLALIQTKTLFALETQHLTMNLAFIIVLLAGASSGYAAPMSTDPRHCHGSESCAAEDSVLLQTKAQAAEDDETATGGLAARGAVISPSGNRDKGEDDDSSGKGDVAKAVMNSTEGSGSRGVNVGIVLADNIPLGHGFVLSLNFRIAGTLGWGTCAVNFGGNGFVGATVGGAPVPGTPVDVLANVIPKVGLGSNLVTVLYVKAPASVTLKLSTNNACQPTVIKAVAVGCVNAPPVFVACTKDVPIGQVGR